MGGSVCHLYSCNDCRKNSDDFIGAVPLLGEGMCATTSFLLNKLYISDHIVEKLTVTKPHWLYISSFFSFLSCSVDNNGAMY